MRRINFVSKYSDFLVLLLLPLFFVFHGFVDNYPSILIKDAIYLLAVYELALFAFAYLFILLLKDRRKASLFTFLSFCLFFFFGAIHDTIKNTFPKSFLGQYSFILPLILCLIVYSFFKIKKSVKSLFKIFSFLTILFLVLLALDAFTLLFTKKPLKNNIAQNNNQLTVCDTCARPDIYLIVADEYAGNKELKEVLHFDNTPFENQLQSLGFHIIKNSLSNYNYTPFAAASLFGMHYLKGIEGYNFSKSDRKICNQVLNNNDFIYYLKSIGYTIKNYSVFAIDHQQPMVATSFIATSKELLTRQTLLGRLDLDLGYHLITSLKIRPVQESSTYHQLKSNHLLINKTIEETKTSSTSPKFVYTHLMMPHYPYYFNKEGKPFPFETLQEGQQSNQERYVEYLQYSNQIFLDLITHVLKNSKTQPIIIFMGDHGFRHFNTPIDTSYHFMNLNSILLPNRNYNNFYDSMSSVNVFRTLLNTQFGQQMPILKDSTVFIKE